MERNISQVRVRAGVMGSFDESILPPCMEHQLGGRLFINIASFFICRVNEETPENRVERVLNDPGRCDDRNNVQCKVEENSGL